MAYRVLIADDSPVMRSFVRRVIELSGFELSECFEASNGEEAMAILRSEWVDAILTDINMPKMDGLQLLAALKASAAWSGIPVVMITTEGGEAKVSEAVKLGATGYVRKPFTADQIKEKLTGVVESTVPL